MRPGRVPQAGLRRRCPRVVGRAASGALCGHRRSHVTRQCKIAIVNEQPPPPDVLIDDRLTVADSPIQGRGLFFSTDLPQDTVVVRLGGRLVSSAQLRALVASAEHDPGAPYVDTITVHPGRHLVLPPGKPQDGLRDRRGRRLGQPVHEIVSHAFEAGTSTHGLAALSGVRTYADGLRRHRSRVDIRCKLLVPVVHVRW